MLPSPEPGRSGGKETIGTASWNGSRMGPNENKKMIGAWCIKEKNGHGRKGFPRGIGEAEA